INESLEYKEDLILEKGQILSESYYRFCRSFAENITTYICHKWSDKPIAIITTNKYFGSDTCSYICKELGYEASGYFFLEGHNIWNWGLRSTADVDVSQLAQLYGGGGHKNASGFVLKSTTAIPNDWIKV